MNKAVWLAKQRSEQSGDSEQLPQKLFLREAVCVRVQVTTFPPLQNEWKTKK